MTSPSPQRAMPQMPFSLGARFDSRFLMAGGYVLALAMTASAIMLGSAPTLSGPLGPASPLVLTLLLLGLAIVLALAAVMFGRVVQLINAQGSDAGARLHLRFIAMFAM